MDVDRIATKLTSSAFKQAFKGKQDIVALLPSLEKIPT